MQRAAEAIHQAAEAIIPREGTVIHIPQGGVRQAIAHQVIAHQAAEAFFHIPVLPAFLAALSGEDLTLPCPCILTEEAITSGAEALFQAVAAVRTF